MGRDLKVAASPLGLRAPVAGAFDLDGSHAVGFGAVFHARIVRTAGSIGKIRRFGYPRRHMSRSSPQVPIFDRLLLLPEEARDPERRYEKSLFLFAFLLMGFVEAVLSVVSVVSGESGLVPATLIHLVLALVTVAAACQLRLHFRPALFATAFAVIALASSTASLAVGTGLGALLWHFLLPTGILILLGERWGWTALIADAGLAVVHALWFVPELAVAKASPMLLVSSELASVVLFLLFLLLLRLIRRTLESYRVEQGQTLDQLSATKTSEARWADQARFLETLMDVIPFPLFHKGNDGRYISANASFRVVFDVEREAVAGQKNEDFLRPDNAKTLAKIELDLKARDSMAVEETVLTHADGQPHDFIVYLMPFLDAAQAPLGSIGVLIDITDRKLREGKLEKLNATKDQLFSIISHDLRGPVGKLKQLLDIYMDDPGIFDKATWETVFHDMRRSTDSLFQLLENLLGWARAQQGEAEVHYETVALDPLVGDVFAVLKLLATDKKIALVSNLKLEGPLLTDRHVLSTILRNLVHNALKFTAPGGKVTVTAEETPAYLWIDVQDTGVGMSDDLIHRIVRRKERVSTFGTGKERGQGIGLGLCQDLARSLGGHLEIMSTEGLGTTIRLHLPTPEL